MALRRRLDRFVVLAELAQGERHGYELERAYARDGVRAWHLTLSQIYSALQGLARDGLASTRVASSSTRPAKRMYAITDAGRRALSEWMRTAPLLPSLKDELLLRAQLADARNLQALGAPLAQRRTNARTRIEALERERISATRAGARIRAASLTHLIDLERLRDAWATEVLTLVHPEAPRTPAVGRQSTLRRRTARSSASHR
jgi:DNA-binding PadR family transcriptional regulator